tara:strand:+ start:5137 stop:5370 length:234 start_codon:yes stop_codon:yes gene_type:complete
VKETQYWDDRYDKAVTTLVRETLTIMESVISQDSQRLAVRRLLRRTIYDITDRLKEDLTTTFEATAETETFAFPEGE